MPMLTRGRANSIMEQFKESTLATLEDQAVIDRYRLIFEPMFKSLLDQWLRNWLTQSRYTLEPRDLTHGICKFANSAEMDDHNKSNP